VAGFLNSFIRHADVLKIANIAQIVNVIAPILTRGDEMLLQTIYYPFVMYAHRREGVALQPVVKGPAYESPSFGFTKFIDTSAILGDGVLHVFLVNRSLDETAQVEVQHPGGSLARLESAEIVTGSHPQACNTFEQPHQVVTQHFSAVSLQDGQASVELPPLSVAALTFRVS
jgi:alpha-N-arabinofuranosidase